MRIHAYFSANRANEANISLVPPSQFSQIKCYGSGLEVDFLYNMYSMERLSEEKLLGEETPADDSDILSLRLRRPWTNPKYLWGFQLIFFLVSLSMLLSAFHYQNPTQQCNCKDHMPMYSPALEAVRNTGHIQRFDGSFARPNAFKGTPSPDIDAAWANITYKDGVYASLVAYAISANYNRRRYQHIRRDAARRQRFGRVFSQASTRDWRWLYGFRRDTPPAALPEYATAGDLR